MQTMNVSHLPRVADQFARIAARILAEHSDKVHRNLGTLTRLRDLDPNMNLTTHYVTFQKAIDGRLFEVDVELTYDFWASPRVIDETDKATYLVCPNLKVQVNWATYGGQEPELMTQLSQFHLEVAQFAVSLKEEFKGEAVRMLQTETERLESEKEAERKRINRVLAQKIDQLVKGMRRGSERACFLLKQDNVPEGQYKIDCFENNRVYTVFVSAPDNHTDIVSANVVRTV